MIACGWQPPKVAKSWARQKTDSSDPAGDIDAAFPCTSGAILPKADAFPRGAAAESVAGLRQSLAATGDAAALAAFRSRFPTDECLQVVASTDLSNGDTSFARAIHEQVEAVYLADFFRSAKGKAAERGLLEQRWVSL